MKIIAALLCLVVLYSCASENELTREQARRQQAIDEIVATTLFKRDLDSLASYNVHKDGVVVIKFDKSVTEKVYTDVVAELRANHSLTGVRAEQGGVEICPSEY